MLNIPETVKALYKQDGVWKNIRAHFPGGELPDITNDDIVEESVKFQESVCSQNVFRFGLTEASVIEFETVGAGNMYGMTMECSSEIDCSSLTAAELAEIQAGTWDGELVLPAASGLTVPVFRVPLGTFRVESCPRDHQAMAHRRVTAYTQTQTDTNDFEKQKDALLLDQKWQKTYKPFATAFVMGQLASRSPHMLTSVGYGATSVELLSESWPLWDKTIVVQKTGASTGSQVRVQMSGQPALPVLQSFNLMTPTSLWKVDYSPSNYDYDAFLESAVNVLTAQGVDPVASGYTDMEALAKDVLPPAIYPLMRYDSENMIVMPPSQIVYPYRGRTIQGPSRTENGYICNPTSASLAISGTSYDLSGFSSVGPVVTRYLPRDTTDLFNFSFEPTLKQSGRNSFADAFSLVDIANGWLEVNGMFATSARNGGNRIVRLSGESPTAISPSEYSQMWFDEYEVEPVGTVRYAYTDEAGEEQIVDYKFGDGASIYDMTENAALKAMAGATPEIIESILDTSFVPYLGPVNFVPIDLAAKGLPYLEAGDALAVTAQDGTVCSSYALRRELGGVQALTDQIDSESGLIIDSEEGA